MQGTYFSDLQDLSKVLSNLKFLLAERVNGFCQTSSIKCGVPVDRCSHNRLVLSVFIKKPCFLDPLKLISSGFMIAIISLVNVGRVTF